MARGYKRSVLTRLFSGSALRSHRLNGYSNMVNGYGVFWAHRELIFFLSLPVRFSEQDDILLR